MNLIYNKLSHLIPFKNCIKERENDEILIVSTENSDIIYLNETSKDFFTLCDGKKNIENIKQQMLLIYEIPEEELENDIVALIRDMQWNNILVLKELKNEKI